MGFLLIVPGSVSDGSAEPAIYLRAPAYKVNCNSPPVTFSWLCMVSLLRALSAQLLEILTLYLSNCLNIAANTNHLYDICTMLDQRRRRWADVVEMLYDCFVFAGMLIVYKQLVFLY